LGLLGLVLVAALETGGGSGAAAVVVVGDALNALEVVGLACSRTCTEGRWD